VLLASREFDAAASACDQFLADSPRAPEADEARWRLAWSFLLGHRFPEAERAFRAIQPPSPHAEAAGKLAEESGRLATRRRKSPLLAGILGIVPGLGHLYCGRTADGLTSLGVNALLGAGTASALSKGADAAGVVLGLLTGSFYGGSIFGGVTWAHRVNRATAQERVDALRREHGL
jgi:TM2 domain-containing membrane protein YozV